jgi:flagellar biosynthesis GTPase FlhF
MSQDSTPETDIIEELRESYQKYGPVRPVIKTKFGIAAGETRKKAVKEWPEEFNAKVQTYYDHLRLKAADNIHKPKSGEWWTEVLTEAAEELKKQGVEPGQISIQLEADFPLSRTSISRYLPQRYKDGKKVMGGAAPRVGAEVEQARLNAAAKAVPKIKLETSEDFMKAAKTLEKKAKKLLSPEEKAEVERKREERNENARKAREEREEKLRTKVEAKVKEETQRELLSSPSFIRKAAELAPTITELEKVKVNIPLPSAEDMKATKEGYEDFKAKVQAILNTPEAKLKGVRFKNWTAHMAIMGVLPSLSCPICGSKDLIWACHNLPIADAYLKAEDSYKKSPGGKAS